MIHLCLVFGFDFIMLWLMFYIQILLKLSRCYGDIYVFIFVHGWSSAFREFVPEVWSERERCHSPVARGGLHRDRGHYVWVFLFPLLFSFCFHFLLRVSPFVVRTHRSQPRRRRGFLGPDCRAVMVRLVVVGFRACAAASRGHVAHSPVRAVAGEKPGNPWLLGDDDTLGRVDPPRPIKQNPRPKIK